MPLLYGCGLLVLMYFDRVPFCWGVWLLFDRFVIAEC